MNIDPRLALAVHYISPVYVDGKPTDRTECHAALIAKVCQGPGNHVNLACFSPDGTPYSAKQVGRDEELRAQHTWHSCDSCSH
ncbi:MAG TPA: hypothetical protein VHV55_26395 [Pirellulales bacterium]|nr:hypothetical protein [Pirellulales bacterium]